MSDAITTAHAVKAKKSPSPGKERALCYQIDGTLDRLWCQIERAKDLGVDFSHFNFGRYGKEVVTLTSAQIDKRWAEDEAFMAQCRAEEAAQEAADALMTDAEYEATYGCVRESAAA
jgi:hypothetical protein